MGSDLSVTGRETKLTQAFIQGGLPQSGAAMTWRLLSGLVVRQGAAHFEGGNRPDRMGQPQCIAEGPPSIIVGF